MSADEEETPEAVVEERDSSFVVKLGTATVGTFGSRFKANEYARKLNER